MIVPCGMCGDPINVPQMGAKYGDLCSECEAETLLYLYPNIKEMR